MKTSLKPGFAQIFSCYPKNPSCPKFGGAAAPLAPPARTPMVIYDISKQIEQRGYIGKIFACWYFAIAITCSIFIILDLVTAQNTKEFLL